MIDKNQVLEFVKKNSLCVFSTVTPDNKSESAVMAYAVMDDFTLIMSSEPTTRKHTNILNNPSVSVIIGGLDSPSLQIDATAQIIEGEKAEQLKAFALSQHPDLKDYLTTTIKFIEVKPVWARYSDFSQNPMVIEEINF